MPLTDKTIASVDADDEWLERHGGACSRGVGLRQWHVRILHDVCGGDQALNRTVRRIVRDVTFGVKPKDALWQQLAPHPRALNFARAFQRG